MTPRSNSTSRRPWYRIVLSSDRAVIAGGIALAAFAAFFPWYVFLHREEFGVRPMMYASDPDLGWAGGGILSASPLVRDGHGGASSDVFDLLATATVPERDRDRATDDDPLDQPFPASVPFRLLFVANGRALIEGGGGVYVVQTGSVLPDHSRLEKLEKRDEEWVIVTSQGDVIAR